jgi:hypothetical protein
MSTRPNRLFTADAGILLYRTGHISDTKLKQALSAFLVRVPRDSASIVIVRRLQDSVGLLRPASSPPGCRLAPGFSKIDT